jgi:hypothetical protein
MTRVVELLPQTDFSLPSPAELDKLRKIVISAHPWLADHDPQAFHHSFWAAGLMFRTPEPCKSRYFAAFVDDASQMLQKYGLPGVDGNSFLSACLAHGDIVWRRGDRSQGVLLEIGLSATYAGAKCKNTWRKLLTGEANLLPSLPLPSYARAGVERGPARIYAQDRAGEPWRDQLAIFLRSLRLLGRRGLVGRRQGLTGRLGGSLKGGAVLSLLKANLRTSAMFCAPWPCARATSPPGRSRRASSAGVFSTPQWPRTFCASSAAERPLEVME